MARTKERKAPIGYMGPKRDPRDEQQTQEEPRAKKSKKASKPPTNPPPQQPSPQAPSPSPSLSANAGALLALARPPSSPAAAAAAALPPPARETGKQRRSRERAAKAAEKAAAAAEAAATPQERADAETARADQLRREAEEKEQEDREEARAARQDAAWEEKKQANYYTIEDKEGIEWVVVRRRASVAVNRELGLAKGAVVLKECDAVVMSTEVVEEGAPPGVCTLRAPLRNGGHLHRLNTTTLSHCSRKFEIQ